MKVSIVCFASFVFRTVDGRLTGRELQDSTIDNAEGLVSDVSSVVVSDNSFIPLQLGPKGVPPPISGDDIFRGYKLDVADGENPLKSYVFEGETEAVPFVHTFGIAKVLTSSRDVVDSMDINGALSVSYGPMISGSGAGSFMQDFVSSKNQISFMYRIVHTAFARKAKVDTIRPIGNFAGRGTRFIESVIYGAQLDVRYTITTEEEVDFREIQADLEGKIGVGPLSVEFRANFESEEGERQATHSMKIEAKASGVNFPVPPTLSFENYTLMNERIMEFNDEYETLFLNIANQDTVDKKPN